MYQIYTLNGFQCRNEYELSDCDVRTALECEKSFLLSVKIDIRRLRKNAPHVDGLPERARAPQITL